MALLNYPDFDNYAFPALFQSTNIDLEKLTVRTADYSKSANPPILHRKELFVTSNYQHYKLFCELTTEAENAGLFESTRTIGYKDSWNKLIRSKGLYLDEEGRIKGEASNNQQEHEDTVIQRHLTAIDRNKLSSPMQLLAKYGYLDGDYSVFDFGCSKGDDVRELEAHGITINSYDPVFHPEGELVSSDLVNLGFVINVIEEKAERTKTLLTAFGLAEKALIVSAMVAGESLIRQFTPYKDGVITSKKTFQKYYSQGELKGYIESVLEASCFALSQGIFIVFKNDDDAQEFLLSRQTYKRNWEHKTGTPHTVSTDTITTQKYAKHQQLLDDFWNLCLDLGRCPSNNEFDLSDQIRRVCGSHKKAFEGLKKYLGEDQFNIAKRLRKEDLLVYFALGLFEKRKSFASMPERLKLDLKTFFNSYSHAIELATELLFSLASPELIEESCIESYSRISCGELNEGHSFVFHIDQLRNVSPEIRAYIGCAAQLYGDIDEFDLVKAHFFSKKVSFMKYDDFSKDVPLLQKRIKVRLKDLDFDTFEYGTIYAPSALITKSSF